MIASFISPEHKATFGSLCPKKLRFFRYSIGYSGQLFKSDAISLYKINSPNNPNSKAMNASTAHKTRFPKNICVPSSLEKGIMFQNA